MDPKTGFGWPWTHVDDTVLIRTGQGVLHSITLNGLTTAGDATLYDGVDNTGAVIAVFHFVTTTSVSVQPITFLYDLAFATGLYIEFEEQALVADLTVMHE